MPPISIDPTLSVSEIAKAIHIENPEDTDRLKLGDVVESWDFTFRWDEDCMPAEELEKWRQIPDPLVDDYLASLPISLISPREDQLQILISQASSSSSPNPSARKLLDHLTQPPPQGVRCSEKTMEDAQECFYRFAGGILLGTFYISLVGGFSSPRITSVLHQTSYLVAPILKTKPHSDPDLESHPSSSGPDAATSYNPTNDQINDVAYAPITPAVKQRTSVRLLETLQFVLDIMGSPILSAQNTVPSPSDPSGKTLVQEESIRTGAGCMKPLVGEGWRSTVRVRLLHGVVRRRVMSTVGREKEEGFDGTGKRVGYDFDKDGYPLNAEDMLLTLASFCVAPLWACQRIGSPIPARLQSAYIAHWRHVGYYLGVPSHILERHMQVDLDPKEGARTDHMRGPNKIFASCLTHLFAHPKDLEDTQRLPPPTLPLLHTVADMPPFVTPLKNHFRAARFFLGDSLATALNIPRTTDFERVRLQVYFLGVTLPERFGKLYWRKSWDAQRKDLTRHLLGIMVCYKLSGRRSMFRPHAVIPGQKTKQEPDLPADVIELETQGEMDKRAAMRAYLKYQGLMIEMVVVGLGVVGLGGWAGWKVFTGVTARFG